MKAGSAILCITPKPGTHLGGSIGGYRACEVAVDPLNARATVFSSGAKTVCFLALDVTIITREFTDRIRDGAAAAFGLDPEAIMVHATQTHSAPSIGHFMVDDEFPNIPPEKEFLRGGDREYAAYASARAVEVIGLALERLEPIQLGAGSGAIDGLAYNRRAVMRDGKVSMPWLYSAREHPAGRKDILHLEGPVDPEVGMLCARAIDGRIAAMLLTFTCHPVNQFAKPGAAASADWPGAWADAMQQYGSQSAPVVLNGCCGNINPVPPFLPDYVPDHRRMGNALAELSKNILADLRFSEDSRLDVLTKNIMLPVREVDATELKTAREYLDANPEPPWLKDQPNLIDPAWCKAAWIWSIEMLRRRSPEVAYEIQAFRVGNTAFVSLPGEPFVEGQLAIKLASPFAHTHVVHCTTQYIAYFPTRDAYPRGGHEVLFCKVAPGALEKIVEEAGNLLRELSAREAKD